MVNQMVERATSDVLIGPDWAMNIEICDVCNHDPVQAKEVVKSIKKRLGSRRSKIQLLALTLLETIVKNCGEIVHMHVAEKNLPRDMVKIVKKKPDFQVKEKILILIDTWQEAFGGPRARYPQYFVAYRDLLRLGVVFPERSESSAPVFTPPQTHPLTSYPQNIRNSESTQDAAESSAEAEFPTLSLSELQSARGVMDVLAEMMNALDPGNKEGLKQDIIIDLVDQCRTYKKRVVHLINSTSDESLLGQGLTLNDELQHLLAKYDSFASGATSVQPEKPKPQLSQVLPDHDAPLIDTGDKKLPDKGSPPNVSLGVQLLLPSPPSATTSQVTTSTTKADPDIDLLSGDAFNSPLPNSVAFVPGGEKTQSSSPPVDASQLNALALVDDTFSSTSNNNNNNNYQSSNNIIGREAYPSSPQFQQQSNFQSPQPSLYSNGSGSGNVMLPQYEQSVYLQGQSSTTWNGQMSNQQQQHQQQQQPPSPLYGAENSTALPPPPWEAQLDNSTNATYFQESSQPMTIGHLTTINNPPVQSNQFPGFQSHPFQNPQPMGGMFPQPSQSVQTSGYIYPQQVSGYGYGYGQVPQQNAQFLDQSMLGLSVRDARNSSYSVPSGKPSKPEDKLFGDLVDISKFKPMKKTSS